MTEPKAYDWAEIGKAHAVNARQIEATLPALDAVARALHAERIDAEAHARAVTGRAHAATDALDTARRDIDVSRTIMRAQTGQTDALALEYLLGHRTDDDAFLAAVGRGLVYRDGTRTRSGFDVLAALNANNKDA